MRGNTLIQCGLIVQYEILELSQNGMGGVSFLYIFTHACHYIQNDFCCRFKMIANNLQFLRTEGGFLESSSPRNVLENLMILNARIGIATQTEYLPTCYTI